MEGKGAKNVNDASSWNQSAQTEHRELEKTLNPKPKLLELIQNWRVLDEISLSDHRYLKLSLTIGGKVQ